MGRTIVHTLLVQFVACLPLIEPTARADAPLSIRKVALSGDVAVGVDPGQVFSQLSYATIDDFGRVAFGGLLTGPGISIQNGGGVWSEGSGSMRLVARRGSPVPDDPNDATFGGFSHFIAIAPDGGVSFFSTLVAQPNRIGIVWQGNGPTSVLARQGDPLPSMEPGSNLGLIDTSEFMPSVANGGVMAFRARFYAPSEGHVQTSVWRHQEGTLSLVARPGDAAPGAPIGAGFKDLISVSTNRHGQMLIRASLAGSGITSQNNNGLWLSSNGTMTKIMRTGDPAPGFPDGTVLGNAILTSRHMLDQSGHTAILSHVKTQDSPTTIFPLYAASTDSMRLVTKTGDRAPGTPDGVYFQSIAGGENGGIVSVSNSGRLSFLASLTGSGVTSQNRDGIWSEGLGELALIARTGDRAPDTPDGVVFDSFLAGSDFAANGVGQLLFHARLRGPGVSSSNNNHLGFWAQLPTGEVKLLARHGDSLEVAPGDFRTIVNIFIPGGNHALPRGTQNFNNRGEFAFSASFTDGTSGVFVIRVPEPATALLLLAGWAVFRRQRRTHPRTVRVP